MKRKRKLKKVDLYKFVTKTARRGSIPGTVEYIGEPRGDEVKIEVTDYSESVANDRVISSVSELADYRDYPGLQWIRVSGVHNADILNEIGGVFNIVSLDLEDIANTTQRPRIEERENYIFLIFKTLTIEPESGDVNIEQVSIILGDNFVITFHETTPKIFEILQLRIHSSTGRIRKLRCDYLVFAIVDIVIDQYFTLIEDIGETIEDIEDGLIINIGTGAQETIYKLKRRLGYVKKTIWPAREVLNALHQSDHVLINAETKMYFRNVYDHTIQIIETLESLRDLTSGMMDLYLSTVSYKMNEVMKVLTIFSALFIPLTFIAGVYGMNFKYFPELEWHNGYFIFWGVIITVTIMMLFYFKRKKWL